MTDRTCINILFHIIDATIVFSFVYLFIPSIDLLVLKHTQLLRINIEFVYLLIVYLVVTKTKTKKKNILRNFQIIFYKLQLLKEMYVYTVASRSGCIPIKIELKIL